MGGAHADVSKHVRAYLAVFAALAVFTAVTVGASFMHFGEKGSHTGNIIVALIIATIKASLVAAIFMHLKWERGASIWVTLVFCAVFFLVLILVPMLTTGDLPPKAEHKMWDNLPTKAVQTSQHGSGH